MTWLFAALAVLTAILIARRVHSRRLDARWKDPSTRKVNNTGQCCCSGSLDARFAAFLMQIRITRGKYLCFHCSIRGFQLLLSDPRYCCDWVIKTGFRMHAQELLSCRGNRQSDQ